MIPKCLCLRILVQLRRMKKWMARKRMQSGKRMKEEMKRPPQSVGLLSTPD